MLLQELHTDWKQNNIFTYKQGLIVYQCKERYLPFGSANRNDYERKDLNKIYTPVFHFEFETQNTDKTIYQSHWVMSYSLAWFLENYFGS